jgi:Flp pilus assembly protein TadD
MTFTRKIKLSITPFVLAVALAIISGCATSGNQAASLHQNPEFPSMAKPTHANNIASRSVDEVGKNGDAPPLSGKDLETLGDSYFVNGNLPSAFINYEKALRSNPKNARLLYKKGLVLLSAGLYEDAERIFVQLCHEEPKTALAHEGLGRTYFQMRRYDDAKHALQKAVELDPSLWASYNILGVICDSQKEYEAALGEYRKALSLRPNEGMLYHNFGVSYSLAGKYREAVEAFRVSIVKGYRESRIFNSLGLSLSKLGLYDEAFEAFKAGGNVASAYNNLGFVYLNEGKYDKAAECFEKAIANSPEFYARASENLKTARACSQRVQ